MDQQNQFEEAKFDSSLAVQTQQNSSMLDIKNKNEIISNHEQIVEEDIEMPSLREEEQSEGLKYMMQSLDEHSKEYKILHASPKQQAEDSSFENDQSQQNLFLREQDCLEMTEPAKVLIIDDDVMNIKMIQLLLANSGHNLDSAQDANQGIKMVAKRVNLTS